MPKKAKKAAAKPAAKKAKKATKKTAAAAEKKKEVVEEPAIQVAAAPAAGAQLAAAGKTTGKPGEGNSSMKNFRHQPDIENFYRFVYENDLRYEALDILNERFEEKRARKKLKTTRTRLN